MNVSFIGIKSNLVLGRGLRYLRTSSYLAVSGLFFPGPNLPLLLGGVELFRRSVTRSLYRPVRRFAALLGCTTGGGSTLSIQPSMTTWRAHGIPSPFPHVTLAGDNPEAEHFTSVKKFTNPTWRMDRSLVRDASPGHRFSGGS